MPDVAEQLKKPDRRAEWKQLKKKHDALITKAKVDFNQKFGPALDKYQSQIEALKKLSEKTEIQSMHTQGILTAGQAVESTVSNYKELVKKLDESAKREMTAFLTAVEADIQGWLHVTIYTQ